jgi:hypothetical protein
VSTDVPEEYIASIFRVSCSAYSSILKRRLYVPPKLRLTMNVLQGVISQKMVFIMTTAMRI